jgi:hypothetical protein
MSFLSGAAHAQEVNPFARLAELEIDPVHLESFKSAIDEGIKTYVRIEPGVLALYAVSEKDNPYRVIVLKSIRMRMRTRPTALQEVPGHYGQNGQVPQTSRHCSNDSPGEGCRGGAGKMILHQ